MLLTLRLTFCGDLRKPVCASCHPKETAAYLKSSMDNTLGNPTEMRAGSAEDQQTGGRLTSEWRNGKMFHRVSEDGLEATYPIRYQIGAGKVGHSYATQIGDYLVESPLSYFRRFGWDISPGFSGAELIDFNRVLTGRCFFCHSNFPATVQGRRVGGSIAAIGCERCHGDTSGHVLHPSAANVVNPAKLDTRARDSICEQCHLEGVARVLNPGKSLHDFKPGQNLEDTLAIFVARSAEGGLKAVSQEEQLALSQCARQSGGKLWCGTCHNPHGVSANRSAEVKAICTSCHPVLPPASHPSGTAQCVSCHMPTAKPSDVAHAALTDHRIRKRPEEHAGTEDEGQPLSLQAWKEPPLPVRERDTALALLRAAAIPGQASLGQSAGMLLKTLPAAGQSNDPEMLAAMGDVLMSEKRDDEAAQLFARASQIDSKSGDYALYLGVALAKVNDIEGARKALRRSIDLDPSLERAYLELSALEKHAGNPSGAKNVLADYLKFNPQGILVRLLLGNPAKR